MGSAPTGFRNTSNARDRSNGIRTGGLILLGIFGAALLYGDGMITPAITVLGAVEGLKVATPLFDHYVVPIAVALLLVIFSIQQYGTHRVGRLFGPIMVLWFVTLAVLGIRAIIEDPFHVSANTDPKGNRSRRRRTKTPTCCCALSAKPTTGSSSAAQSTRPRLPMPTRPARSRRSATGATPSSPSTPSASSSTWVLERHRRSVDHSSRPHPQLIHGIYNEFDSRSRRLG